MRKIFSILVVLMMVAGTFVSCSMPTNDTPTVSTVDIGVKDIKDIPNCDLSYLVLTNGNKAICTDTARERIEAASDKQLVLNALLKKDIHENKLADWVSDIYYVGESDGEWIIDARWNTMQYALVINNAYENYVDVNLYGLKRIYLPAEHIHQ